MALEEALLSCALSLWKIDQVVALDWYDGPRQGVAALTSPRCEFVFDLLAERFNSDGLNDRLFRLRELPPGSVQSVLGAIPQLGAPSKPVWRPVWLFSAEEERKQAEQTIEAIQASARRTDIVVLSQDMVQIAGVWSVQHDLADDRNWFSSLNIP